MSQQFPVPPEILGEELRHIERHVLWMRDAIDINFGGDQREGLGTQFLCTTKVGPFVTQDTMVITQWVTNKPMGVEHHGLIRGSGTFHLESTALAVHSPGERTCVSLGGWLDRSGHS